ncbi:hypothetical protein PRVXH_002269 [Proteinivorax hydrogeniformans]|uniref:Uncharacterized protein n=1 Tax=Proteinivorax hydrogeniformans TaxID=1826727 RepID=A0AAU8HRW3_9FIRM
MSISRKEILVGVGVDIYVNQQKGTPRRGGVDLYVNQQKGTPRRGGVDLYVNQ